jgi:hypothetical protein
VAARLLEWSKPMVEPGASNVLRNHVLNAMSNADLALL